MANKPKSNNWNEVQLVIAAITMAITLGLWNLFSTPAKTELSKQVEPTSTPPPTEIPQIDPTPQVVPTLLPHVKIYLGGTAPQVQQVSAPSRTTKKSKSSGGSGGTVTTTKSS